MIGVVYHLNPLERQALPKLQCTTLPPERGRALPKSHGRGTCSSLCPSSAAYAYVSKFFFFLFGQVSRTEGNFHFAPGHRLHRHANELSFVDRIQVRSKNVPRCSVNGWIHRHFRVRIRSSVQHPVNTTTMSLFFGRFRPWVWWTDF